MHCTLKGCLLMGSYLQQQRCWKPLHLSSSRGLSSATPMKYFLYPLFCFSVLLAHKDQISKIALRNNPKAFDSDDMKALLSKPPLDCLSVPLLRVVAEAFSNLDVQSVGKMAPHQFCSLMRDQITQKASSSSITRASAKQMNLLDSPDRALLLTFWARCRGTAKSSNLAFFQ